MWLGVGIEVKGWQDHTVVEGLRAARQVRMRCRRGRRRRRRRRGCCSIVGQGVPLIRWGQKAVRV
jgi:hypothetical protein